MLFLNQEDIAKLVDLDEMMDRIEEAYRIYGEGKFYMPHRPTVEHRNKTLLYMPCFLENSFGTKILTSFPENAKLGLPSLNGLMLINDYETGAPLAMLDGQSVTAYRTGAVGGVGMRHLSSLNCHSVGIVGAGTQGFYQALYACAARKIRKVFVFNHSARDLTSYLQRLREAIGNPEVEVTQCFTIEELVANSDIICTTTPAEAPVLPNDAEALRGKCIIAVGSFKPTMREIPDAIWQLVDKVYTELPFACEESGDLSQPLEAGLLKLEDVVYMNAHLAARECIREGVEEAASEVANETTYFKSVGMGLFDICIANKMLEVAKRRKIGQEIKM